MNRLITAIVVILALPPCLWAIATAYMNITGIVVEGRVIGKREAIVMPGGDSWDHLFEVTYRYQAFDTPYPITATHRVDSSLYRELQAGGSSVRVRYSRWPVLRPMVGIGSFLADSSARSRLGYAPVDVHVLVNIAVALGSILLALVAYGCKSRWLGLFALLLGATLLPVILLAITAFVAFPVLFWMWRHNPRKGYGWAALGSTALTIAALSWRIPQPTLMPATPRREATAIVRQVRVVDEIWTAAHDRDAGGSDGGQGIRWPFQMLDLEFTPEGASTPIHFMDRVDLNSVAGLREGAKLQIVYSLTDPYWARISGGTRDFARQALIYLLALTYGIGAFLAFIVFPAISSLESRIRSGRIFAPIAPGEAIKQVSRFPTDDPRRKIFEKYLAAREVKRNGFNTDSK